MPEDCPFCRIVTGDIPARIVHRTDSTVAFLDANPLATGHTLVVPKQHYPRLADVPGDEAAELFGAVNDLVPKIEAAVGADATSVGINDGPAAGQEVPHTHIHIVPRREGDGGAPFHAVGPGGADPSDSELDAVAEEIRNG